MAAAVDPRFGLPEGDRTRGRAARGAGKRAILRGSNRAGDNRPPRAHRSPRPRSDRDGAPDRRLLQQGQAVVLLGVDLLVCAEALTLQPGLAALGDLQNKPLDVHGVGDHPAERQPAVGAPHVHAVERDDMKVELKPQVGAEPLDCRNASSL